MRDFGLVAFALFSYLRSAGPRIDVDVLSQFLAADKAWLPVLVSNCFHVQCPVGTYTVAHTAPRARIQGSVGHVGPRTGTE